MSLAVTPVVPSAPWSNAMARVSVLSSTPDANRAAGRRPHRPYPYPAAVRRVAAGDAGAGAPAAAGGAARWDGKHLDRCRG